MLKVNSVIYKKKKIVYYTVYELIRANANLYELHLYFR